MKKFVFLITILAISVAFFACSDNTEGLQSDKAPEQPQAKSRCLTPEEAKQNVMAFLEALENSTPPESRSSVHKKRVISDIQVIGEPNLSRLSDSDLVSDSSLYIFNFKDSTGFIIGGTQLNQPPVYAIIDEGSYSYKMYREETNEGFKWFVSQCIDAVDKYEDAPILYPPTDPMAWAIVDVIEPQIIAKWDQEGFPKDKSYGKYFSNYKAGCTSVAAAQILYKYKKPTNVKWTEENGTLHSEDIRWFKIHLDCESNDGKLSPYNTPASMDMVAHLLRYLGTSFGMGAASEGVGTQVVVDWFNRNGLHASDIKKYDENIIESAVKNKNPVLVRGEGIQGKNAEGHIWLIDGYINAYRNGKNEKLFYCNWGWSGNKNGYYLSKVFNTTIGPEINRKPQSRTDDPYNFRYDLKYSVISE